MISKDSDQSAWPEGTVPRRLPSLSQPLHVRAAQGHLTEKHLAETGGGAPTTTLRFYNSLELAELGKMLSSQSQVCDSWEGSKGKRLKGETRGPGPCLSGGLHAQGCHVPGTFPPSQRRQPRKLGVRVDLGFVL